MAITRAQQVRQMLKDGSKKPAMQGGGPNYLGKQPEVTVPRRWKSSPDHPDTELAYITEPEKKVLIALNMHGGLEDGKPNKGPKGVISLQGDMGSIGGGGGNKSGGGGGSNFGGGDDRRESYITDYSSKAKVKGGGKQKPFSPGGGPGDQDYEDFQYTSKNRTKAMEDKFKRDRGLMTLNLLRAGVPKANTPSFALNTVLNAFQPFRNFSLRGNIDYFKERPKAIERYGLTADGYAEYMRDRLAGKIDAAGNLAPGYMEGPGGEIIPTGNDGRDTEAEQLALLAQNQNLQSKAPTTTDNPLGGLAFRFLADGGMPEDAPVGGIMDIESGRQMYFLGKLVKKATRAVKKVAKSKIGKAALIGALGYGLGGGTFFGKMLPGVTRGGQGIGGFGGLSAIFGNVGDMIGGKTLGDSFAKFGASKLGLGITAASLLPMLGLGKGDEDEDEAEEILRGSGLDIASIRNNPYTFRSRVGDGTGLMTRAFQDGGRIGFRDGTSEFMDFVRSMGLSEDKLKQLDINSYNAVLQAFQRAKEGQKPQTEEKEMAEGGKAEPVAKETMPLLKMGGKEMDLRDEGGFVPIGRMERADDVPARLSKNEFVFTADAVRNAGGGDIDKGAEVMYNMMQNLESGGEVSEESQGLKGAREMFQTSKRLEEVL